MKTDVIIIGCGPAGAAAAIYSARAGLSSVIFEGNAPGGQVSLTDRIDNYPGFEQIEGWELATKLAAQVESTGALVKYEQVRSAELSSEVKRVITDSGEYSAKAVIIAGGAKRRTLGVDREEQLVGRGVSYCAVCDGGFYKDKTVAVVGGGETAVSDAIYLSRICRKVYLIHRRDELRASRSKKAQLKGCTNVELILGANVTELIGAPLCEILLDNGQKLEINGLFVAIGTIPDTDIYDVSKENGYIITNERMETNLSGVFAAGDIRKKEVRQIITAASDGAIAAISAAEFIDSLELQ